MESLAKVEGEQKTLINKLSSNEWSNQINSLQNKGIIYLTINPKKPTFLNSILLQRIHIIDYRLQQKWFSLWNLSASRHYKCNIQM